MIDLTDNQELDGLVVEVYTIMEYCNKHNIPFRDVYDASKSLYELYTGTRAWDCGTNKATSNVAPTVDNPLGQVLEKVTARGKQ